MALATLEATLGRPLSGNLADKFLDYVKAQQQNARLQKELEDNVRKAMALGRGSAAQDGDLSEVLLDLTQTALDIGRKSKTPIIWPIGRQYRQFGRLGSVLLLQVYGCLPFHAQAEARQIHRPEAIQADVIEAKTSRALALGTGRRIRDEFQVEANAIAWGNSHHVADSQRLKLVDVAPQAC